MPQTRKLLIVEDEAAMLTTLSEKFKKENLSVFTAVNGEEGFNAALREKPDLILLDLVMPKMDGMSMMKKLREDKWGHDAKAIFLTNMNDASLVAEAAKVGVYDFLVKTDWRLEDVVRVVQEKLAGIPEEEE